MRLWRPRNVLRTALLLAFVGLLTAAFLTGDLSTFGGAALAVAACAALVEIGSRLRTRRAGDPDDVLELDGRAHARRLELPWRSDPEWGSFDLSVSDRPGSDWFSDWYSFQASAGDTITIRAQAELPGPGLEIRLFAPGDGLMPGISRRSDGEGRVGISTVTHFGGTHLLHVRIGTQGYGLVQRYRLSVAGPIRTSPGPTLEAGVSHFADVPLWYPYHDAIQAVTERRIMSGDVDGGRAEFFPDRPIWTADLEYALARSLVSAKNGKGPAGGAGIPQTGAETSAEGEWDGSISRERAVRAVLDALQTVAPGTLDACPPTFVSSFAEAQPPADPSLVTAEYNGLLAGIPHLGTQWELWAPLTRGEAAHLLHGATQVIRGIRPEDTALRRMHAPASRADAAATSRAFSSSGDLVTGFVPGAHDALDQLMGSTSIDDIDMAGSDVQIDAAEMRATIESMRTKLGTQHHEGSDTPPEDEDGHSA